MNLRDAFEEGIVRGKYLSELASKLEDDNLLVDERNAINNEIQFVQQEVNEYIVALGGTTKEHNGLTIRSCGFSPSVRQHSILLDTDKTQGETLGV